jgi:hypothetical protein
MANEREPAGGKRAGQFQKGQSGNPKGRPRKSAKDQTDDVPEARHPTRTLLRREAQRKIVMRTAEGETRITVLEGVLRATMQKAAQGSVFAQRTVLQLMHREDDRYHLEQQAEFDRWYDYKKNCETIEEDARKRGVEVEDWLIHPDDVVLNETNLSVRIVGPVTEEGHALMRVASQLQELAYEMVLFTDEAERCSVAGKPNGRIGGYMLLYLLAREVLPPRLRRTPAQLSELVERRVWQGKVGWGEDLRRRCEAAEFPFITGVTATVELKKVLSKRQ